MVDKYNFRKAMGFDKVADTILEKGLRPIDFPYREEVHRCIRMNSCYYIEGSTPTIVESYNLTQDIGSFVSSVKIEHWKEHRKYIEEWRILCADAYSEGLGARSRSIAVLNCEFLPVANFFDPEWRDRIFTYILGFHKHNNFMTSNTLAVNVQVRL